MCVKQRDRGSVCVRDRGTGSVCVRDRGSVCVCVCVCVCVKRQRECVCEAILFPHWKIGGQGATRNVFQFFHFCP